MDIEDSFQSEWIKHAYLKGSDQVVIIDSVTLEEMKEQDGSTKNVPVVHFRQDTPNKMSINKTNKDLLVAALGTSDTDKWKGRAITLHPDKVFFQGRLHDCVRVRPQAPAQSQGNPELAQDDNPFKD